MNTCTTLRTLTKKMIICTLALFLIVGTFASCNSKDEKTTSLVVSSESDIWSNAIYKENTEIGTGSKKLEVEIEVNEHTILLTVNTDSTTLGDALIENDIVKGEEGEYGLYVKEVNGITADYDIDSSYWAFYQDGEYMNVGIESAEINGGEHYEIVYTKG